MPGHNTPEGAAETPAREGASLASQTTPKEEREGLLLPKSTETNAPPVNSNGLRSLSVETVALPGGGARAPSVNEAATVESKGENMKWEGGEEGEGLGVLREFRSVPWKAYATNGQILTITAAHMAHNWGLYVMLAWLPTYFSQVQGKAEERRTVSCVEFGAHRDRAHLLPHPPFPKLACGTYI